MLVVGREMEMDGASVEVDGVSVGVGGSVGREDATKC